MSKATSKLGVTDCAECDPAGPTCTRCVALLEQEAQVQKLSGQVAELRGRLNSLGVEFDLAMHVIEVLRGDVADLKARVSCIEGPQP